MTKFKSWFHSITFGETKKYLQITLWNFFDSFVMTIPYTVMLIAICWHRSYCTIESGAKPTSTSASASPVL